VSGAGGTWWEQGRLPQAVAQDHLDVFFSPAYTTALRLRVPVVLAIHDVSFVAHPEWFGAREGLRRRWLTNRSAWKARTIITISEFSRREIMDRLGVPADRIIVIAPGVQPLTTERADRSGGVLYVGSIFNRRRLPDLIRAFAPLARRDPSLTLDLVGDNRTRPHQDLLGFIAREGLEQRARWRAYLPDEDLRQLYASARAFAFLSEYEGLGLTPLEALAAGVPTVLLDTAVAHESCGSAALYVPQGDIPALTAALQSLLADEPTRARLLAAAPQVLSAYRWPDAARATLAVIAGAA
jgi:glycosyltransferase involved in cell wall biosynthesis